MTTSLTKIRTRVNRKKIEKGNNHYGRSGNLRCWPCRKRRGKVCVFPRRVSNTFSAFSFPKLSPVTFAKVEIYLILASN